MRSEVEKLCAEHGLNFRRDELGNVLVQLKTGPRQRPLVLAAHLDHPGFEILRPLGPGRWLAEFRGGVPDEYFHPGIPVRLMPGAVGAKLGRRLHKKRRIFEIIAARALSERARFAVWDLEDFTLRQGHIHARACDDLIGVAAVLATLLELKRSRARVNVVGALSRAEEIGFQGALAMAATGGIPKNSLVISLETSRELPGVKMGQGVILRVGDRTSIFDSKGMRFLAEVAEEARGRRSAFRFQRGLMGGGTCEATAYQEFGFQSAAVCVALGNYHNCAAGNKIRAEYIDVGDACSMVELLVAAARAMPRFDKLTSKLPARLQVIARRAQRALTRR